MNSHTSHGIAISARNRWSTKMKRCYHKCRCQIYINIYIVAILIFFTNKGIQHLHYWLISNIFSLHFNHFFPPPYNYTSSNISPSILSSYLFTILYFNVTNHQSPSYSPYFIYYIKFSSLSSIQSYCPYKKVKTCSLSVLFHSW